MQTLLLAAMASNLKTETQWSWCPWIESCPLSDPQLPEWWEVGTVRAKWLPGPWVTAMALCSWSQAFLSQSSVTFLMGAHKATLQQAGLELCSLNHSCSQEPTALAFHWFPCSWFHASNSFSASDTQSGSYFLTRALPDTLALIHVTTLMLEGAVLLFPAYNLRKLRHRKLIMFESSRTGFPTQSSSKNAALKGTLPPPSAGLSSRT